MVTANSTANQASYALKAVKQLAEILVIFPYYTGNKFIYRFFEANDPHVPTTGLPGGTEITIAEAEKGEYVGDGIAYTVPFQHRPRIDPWYLKMHCQNDVSQTLIASAVAAVVV